VAINSKIDFMIDKSLKLIALKIAFLFAVFIFPIFKTIAQESNAVTKRHRP